MHSLCFPEDFSLNTWELKIISRVGEREGGQPSVTGSSWGEGREKLNTPQFIYTIISIPLFYFMIHNQ